MKRIIKKNQIIVLVIALMLVSAGYLSYTTNLTEETITTNGKEENSIEYAGIGDAKLVSTNVTEENNEVAIVPNEVTKENENNDVESNTVTTSKKVSNEVNEYFSSSRLTRENMYSQMIDTYEKILENDSINEAQKSVAQSEIQNINNIKNKIMICENLIKTKEIEDLIIFVNDTSVSVVIRTDELKQEQIAQIQNIIAREMNVEITNIHISNK